ncbi:MAG: hypothetical protein HY842_07900 [Bacteroidetes bacterium]|nr:hypothetical protein [Bacteroidota bacterium]
MKKHFFLSSTGLLFATLFLLCFAACTVPAAYLDPTLGGESGRVMPVEGRNKAFNQKLSFGPYHSGKVKRGWTTTTTSSVSGISEVQHEKKKFSFMLNDGSGNASEVRLASNLSTSDLVIFEDNFRIRMDGEDVFAGVISLKDKGGDWDFAMTNLNKIVVFDPAKGQLTNGKETIHIEEERRLADGTRTIAGYTGFNFLLDDKLVGSVDLIDRKGKVTLSNSLSGEQQFVLANAAAALLLWKGAE